MAVQWTGDDAIQDELRAMFPHHPQIRLHAEDGKSAQVIWNPPQYRLMVYRLQVPLHAWIVRDRGDVTVCPDDQFQERYEVTGEQPLNSKGVV